MTELEKLRIRARAEAVAPKTTNLVGQVGTGANEGIAGMVGLPVDAVTGAINATSGLIGSDFRIENPVGGSASISKLLAPFMTAESPDTRIEKFARGVGREVGASAIPGGIVARKAGVAPVAIAEGVAALTGEGAAAGAEALGGGETVQDIARLTGNVGGGYAAVRPAKPKAPTTQGLLTEGAEGIDRAVSAGRTVAPSVSDSVATAARRTLTDEGLIRPSGKIQKRYEAARDVMTLLDEYGATPMSPQQAQNLRRQAMEVASAGGSQGRIGSTLVGEIDDQIIDPHLPGLRDANATYARGKRAEAVDTLIDRAGRQAARSGTGGNTVNAIRQRADALLRQIEDGTALGYSDDEISALRAVVEGGPIANTLRLGGFLAPSTGKLQSAIGGAGYAATGFNPAVLAAIGVSEGSKAGAEYMTKRQIRQLAELIRNGAPLRRPEMTERDRAILAALTASQAPESMPSQ